MTLCACCEISGCREDGCSRTEVVTCDLCRQECSCGGCLVDQARRGQHPYPATEPRLDNV